MVAGELCEHHGRCDTLDVAQYYLALSDEELARGVAYEERYRELWSEVAGARDRGLGGAAWLVERDRILVELAVLAARSGADADHAPAGRALSLSALLRAESLERRRLEDSMAFRNELRAGHAEVARALEIFRDSGLTGPRLEALWVEGRLHRLSNEGERARRSFEALLALAERTGYDVYAVRALEELLRLARERGDAHGRLRLIERLSRMRRPDQSWTLVREYADWMIQRDRPEDAAALLQRYPPSEESERTDWHLYLGNAVLRAGDLAAADERLAEFEERELDGSRSVFARALWWLERGEPQEVVAELGGGVLDLEHEPRAIVIGRTLLGEAYLELGRPEAAARELEQALGLASLYRGRLDEGDENVFGEWVGLHAVVLAAHAAGELGEPLEAARLIESFQSRRLRALRSDGEVHLGRDALLEWAGDFELGLVTWAVGADSSVVAHVAPESSALPPAWSDALPRGRSEVRRAARRLRQAVLDGDERGTRALAREVGAELFPPALIERLRALAEERAAPRLLVLAHGPTESLALELVLAELDLATLVPVVLPGLPHGEGRGAAPKFDELGDWCLVAGGGDAELPDLPEAAREIAELEASLGSSAARAHSRDELEAALAAGRPVHVASHLRAGCDCDETRLAPLALVLADGESLCSHRVADLAPRSPLVVLAACESTAGRFVDAEGLEGLTRALLEGGTRNVLVTNWPVGDAAARRFALDFHVALSAGELPSVAAAGARRGARERGAPASEWAAFRLIGLD